MITTNINYILNITIFLFLIGTYPDDIIGYVFVLFILTIAATESAIGLAILTIYYKLKQTIQMDIVKTIKS